MIFATGGDFRVWIILALVGTGKRVLMFSRVKILASELLEEPLRDAPEAATVLGEDAGGDYAGGEER